MENECWRMALNQSYSHSYEEAKNNFQKLLTRVAPKADKTRSRLLFNMALLEHMQGNHDSSIQYITKSIQAEPSLPVLYFQRGVFLHQLGRLREAMIDYSETLRMYAKDEKEIDFRAFQLPFSLSRSQILYNRALAAYALQLYHRAYDDLTEAIHAFSNPQDKEVAQQLLDQVQDSMSHTTWADMIQRKPVVP